MKRPIFWDILKYPEKKQIESGNFKIFFLIFVV